MAEIPSFYPKIMNQILHQQQYNMLKIKDFCFPFYNGNLEDRHYSRYIQLYTNSLFNITFGFGNKIMLNKICVNQLS